MKSILFLFKLFCIYSIGAFTLFFIWDINEYGEFRYDLFILAFVAAFFAFTTHQISKKYNWNDDYFILLIRITYKRYINYIRRSKDRMREQLKNKDN